jgi:hypothetical protein
VQIQQRLCVDATSRFFSLFAGSKLICTSSAIQAILKLQRTSAMGRNLYILAATLGVLALVSLVLSFTNVAHQPGSPGDAALWRMTSIALLCVALIIALLGILSALFEQAERRAAAARQQRRRRSQ